MVLADMIVLSVALAIVLLVLAAWRLSTRHTPSTPTRMESAAGGAVTLCEALASREPGQTLSGWGLRHQVHTGHMPPARGAQHRFAKRLRDTWHATDGEHYYIDPAGRPAGAFVTLPHQGPKGHRNLGVQYRVGKLGDALCPAGGDYDGGHLIGAQLGGYGRRANLVPQAMAFNRGVWKRCETSVARALDRLEPATDIRLGYYVRAVYDVADSPIPTRIGMLLCYLRPYTGSWLEQLTGQEPALSWTVNHSVYVEFVNHRAGGSWLRRWLALHRVRTFLHRPPPGKAQQRLRK